MLYEWQQVFSSIFVINFFLTKPDPNPHFGDQTKKQNKKNRQEYYNIQLDHELGFHRLYSLSIWQNR